MFSEMEHLGNGPNKVYGYEVFSASHVSITRATLPGTTLDVILKDGGAGIKATLIAGGKGHFQISGQAHLPVGVKPQNGPQNIVHLLGGGYVLPI